jgi:hypothetical protein
MTNATVTQEVMIATKEDISRLEGSIKELTEVVKNVILLGERQSVQGQRIGDLETENGILRAKIESLERTITSKYDELNTKVNTWVSRGVGAWAAVAVIFAVVKVVMGH